MIRSKLLLSVLIVLWILNSFVLADTTAVFQRVEQLADSLQQQFCPDRRTSVWDIQVEYDSGEYVLRGETDNRDARYVLYRLVGRALPELTFRHEVLLLPDDVLDENTFALAENSVAILRRRPGVTQEIVTQTLRGLPMEILKLERGYYLVRTDDGYLGWISDDRVVVGDNSFRRNWEEASKVVYIELEGMVYSKRTRRSLPVSDVVLGNRFKLIKKGWFWTAVEYPDGRRGFMRSKALQDLDAYLQKSLNQEEVLKTACAMHGRPYMWGAASPKLMDCSGFTQIVFRHNGYILPRDASMQVFAGTAVDTTDFPQNLRPADLLFFSPVPDRITHVAIYIGGGRFIHCAGRVRIDSFNPNDPNYNEYRRHSIRAVRRISAPE